MTQLIRIGAAAFLFALATPSGGRELTGPAFVAAIEHGDVGEDRSQGHSLNHGPATPNLRRVLRESSDSTQRALAAQVLGYVADKQGVVDDLVDGMSDPSESVRNNAMRALLVFAEATPTPTRPVTRVPYQPFIPFLNSPVWSDRNKAAGALAELSKRRDRRLLSMLTREAMASLVDMARWKSRDHAEDAFMILGRIAGLSDGEIRAVWDRGERETVIGAALNRH